MQNNILVKETIKHSVFRLEENNSKILSCLEWLSEDEIWEKPNESSNSMGNLVLHLCGNLTQYLLSSLGKVEDKRDRDAEFSASKTMDKQALIDKLNTTVNQCTDLLQSLDQNSLESKYTVQGYHYSGIGNIIHAVEHFSYHTGQIAFWTKILRRKDLGFYAGMDLNKKNER
ncbi:DUF1572 domain-containing protein [Echinicola soli]|uniref:DUF1572 domain-containing protein n=1 Tax=Echinicola soli TaxID=2591634 RepID=A0A514CF06_9BACT|nr:DinB family protein [Echinicola soli]QDH78376.1 DUF1572 domain-containing protein [Echinicola soli]